MVVEEKGSFVMASFFMVERERKSLFGGHGFSGEPVAMATRDGDDCYNIFFFHIHFLFN